MREREGLRERHGFEPSWGWLELSKKESRVRELEREEEAKPRGVGLARKEARGPCARKSRFALGFLVLKNRGREKVRKLCPIVDRVEV